MRPTEIFPREMVEALSVMYGESPDWLKVISDEEGDGFKVVVTVPNNLVSLCRDGTERAGMMAASCWIGQGPKVFVPTLEQCRVMEQVEVNITTRDYTQPYPSLMVVLPKNVYPPFKAVLCHHTADGVFIGYLFTPGNRDDIVTLGKPDGILETYIREFRDDCANEKEAAALALRVGANLCLALSNYGSRIEYLYPKEVTSDKHLAHEKTDRGDRARKRIALAVQQVSFDQEIKLHRVEGSSSSDHEGGHPPGGTGVSMPPHWRKGHWAMQSHGEHHSLRKRIFRKPVLVRGDLLLGDKSNTSVTYKG